MGLGRDLRAVPVAEPHVRLFPAREGSPEGESGLEARNGTPHERRRVASRRNAFLTVAGAAVALVVAASLFSRFSIDGSLARDEAVYAYGGQQLAEGIPFYVSIFDQKTPLAPMIAGAAVAIGREFGANDVHAIRVMFFFVACLTVVAVYLLATWLFASRLAGVVTAAAFASFKGFALGALTGPQAKQAAIFFAVLSMALVVRRWYFWGAFAGSLAFLAWQPLAGYVAVALAASALATQSDQRWKCFGRACAGAVTPLLGMTLYLWLADALDDFISAAFVFPVTYLERADEPLSNRLRRIVSVVDTFYDNSEVLFWGGLALFLCLLAVRLVKRRSELWAMLKDDPYVNVVALSFVPMVAFSVADFQGSPDVYPLLPYAAIGIGAGYGLISTQLKLKGLRRIEATAGTAVVVGLAVVAWVSYSADEPGERALVLQRTQADRIEQLLDSGDTLYSLGDPRPLVFTQRPNPSPYILLIGGMDAWAVAHTPGGFEGWTEEIRAADPEVIFKGGGWHTEYARRMDAWLRSEYAPVRIRGRLVFVKPEIRDRAERRGLLAASGARSGALSVTYLLTDRVSR